MLVKKTIFPGDLPDISAKKKYTMQETARDESQKYKEGKFIIEKAKVTKDGIW